jgi:Luciferase-like monooxygenase
MTALTMAAISDDRLTLGLGTSDPQVVEALHGRPFKAPLTRMKLGDTEMVRNRIRTYRNAGDTTLRVGPAGRYVAERLATLGRLMDLVRAVNTYG